MVQEGLSRPLYYDQKQGAHQKVKKSFRPLYIRSRRFEGPHYWVLKGSRALTIRSLEAQG